MKKTLAAATLAGSIALTGCFGNFGLTKTIYNAVNNGISNVVVKEIVFFFGTVPVGGLAIWADWLIFNTLEYWTGTKIFAAGDSHLQSDANGNQVASVKMDDGSLYMQMTDKDGNQNEVILQEDEEVVRILDAQGNTLKTIAKSE
jgi:hypothetical protein